MMKIISCKILVGWFCVLVYNFFNIIYETFIDFLLNFFLNITFIYVKIQFIYLNSFRKTHVLKISTDLKSTLFCSY